MMKRNLWIAIFCVLGGLASGLWLRPTPDSVAVDSLGTVDREATQSQAHYPAAATLQAAVAVVNPDDTVHKEDAAELVSINQIHLGEKKSAANLNDWQDTSYKQAAAGSSSSNFSDPLVIEIPTRSAAGNRQVRIPAALAFDAYLDEMNFEHLDELDAMVDVFVNEIQYGDDPEHPDYAHRWQAAAEDIDYRFRLFYGDRSFVRMNLRAAQEADAGAY